MESVLLEKLIELIEEAMSEVTTDSELTTPKII